jgi:hypothetical protein
MNTGFKPEPSDPSSSCFDAASVNGYEALDAFFYPCLSVVENFCASSFTFRKSSFAGAGEREVFHAEKPAGARFPQVRQITLRELFQAQWQLRVRQPGGTANRPLFSFVRNAR